MESSNPFERITISFGDIVRATGDLAMSVVRYNPTSGYLSSHSGKSTESQDAKDYRIGHSLAFGEITAEEALRLAGE